MKTIILLASLLTLLAGCVVTPLPANHYGSTYHSTSPNNTSSLPQSPPMIPTSHQPRVMPAVAVNNPIPVAIPGTSTANTTSNKISVTDQPPVISVSTAPTKPLIPTPQILPNSSTTKPLAKGQLRQLDWIAQRIHKNQNGGDTRQLIKWNDKEQFVNLGIGNLIWYPAGKTGRFRETFPEFLDYAKAHNVSIPAWIAQRPARGGPWRSKSHFDNAQNDKQMQELHSFIGKTFNIQANFMAQRLEHALPQMLNQLPPEKREHVLKNYQAVANTPGGFYPLLDYAQFKGLGVNRAERYRDQGWGLLQVLQNMDNVDPGAAALAEFMRAADDTLVTRIANAPPEYREARLLTGWLKRVNTYRPMQQARH